jgi:hypothetical protein
MATLKTFADHFYFSLACLAVGFVILYALLSAIGYGFAVGQNIWAILGAWVALSAAAAGILTQRTLQKRKDASILFTRRKS